MLGTIINWLPVLSGPWLVMFVFCFPALTPTSVEYACCYSSRVGRTVVKEER